MIKPKYKYEVKFARRGESKKGNKYCSFNISEKVTEGGETMWASWRCMVMEDLDVRDGDSIEMVEIESISSGIYRGKIQHTLWCKVKLIIPEPEYAEAEGEPDPNSYFPDPADLEEDATDAFDM